MAKFWIKVTFWENVKKTISIGAAPATAGVHFGGGSDFWVGFTAVMAGAGAVLAIWIADQNKNGIVDIFE